MATLLPAMLPHWSTSQLRAIPTTNVSFFRSKKKAKNVGEAAAECGKALAEMIELVSPSAVLVLGVDTQEHLHSQPEPPLIHRGRCHTLEINGKYSLLLRWTAELPKSKARLRVYGIPHPTGARVSLESWKRIVTRLAREWSTLKPPTK
jgi:hypothetical protein